MKILAVRMAEVGCFLDGVAVEGFSGALDVLSGANEFGKSTLFAALRAAFTMSHTATGKAPERLRPYAGGAPLVEVDFEVADETWRLRKRFLAGRSAQLVNLATGERQRNSDAEARLADLVGGVGERARGLLWVAQRDGLEPAPVDREVAVDLETAVGAEISSAIGAGLAAIAAEIDARLEAFVSGARRQPRGLYKEAMAGHAAVSGRLADARQRQREADERLNRILASRQTLAVLTDVTTVAARRSETEAAAAALVALDEAVAQLRLAEESLKALAAAERDAARQLAELAQGLAAEQEAATRLAATAGSIGDAKRVVTAIDTEIADRMALRSRLANELSVLQSQQASVELRQRISIAELAAAEMAAAGALIDGAVIRDVDVAVASRLEREVSHLTTSAATPPIGVSVRYAARAKARFRWSDGTASHDLDDGETATFGPGSTVSIAGVGELRATVAATASGSTSAEKLQVARSELAALLARLAVGSATDVAAAWQLIDDARRRYDAAATRLSIAAPQGPAALHSSLAAITSSPADLQLGDGPDIAGRISAAQTALAAAAASLDDLIRKKQQVAIDVTRGEAEHVHLSGRLDELRKALPPAAERDEKHALAATMLRTAADAHSQAIRQVTAFRDAAGEPPRREAAASRLAAAQRATSEADIAIRNLRLEIARLEGQMAADSQDGLGEIVNELIDEEAAAAMRLARLERDTAALQRLQNAVLAVQQARRHDSVLPARTAIEPLLRRLLPDARLQLDSDYGAASVERSGRSEPIERLSQGTREQIAIIVRLGLAELYARSGTPVPVILDDALVYSDDLRMERMLRTLEAAARQSQVIVLTCREKAFADLAGQRLKLVPWQQAAI